jgi:hypothetical protein
MTDNSQKSYGGTFVTECAKEAGCGVPGIDTGSPK